MDYVGSDTVAIVHGLLARVVKSCLGDGLAACAKEINKLISVRKQRYEYRSTTKHATIEQTKNFVMLPKMIVQKYLQWRRRNAGRPIDRIAYTLRLSSFWALLHRLLLLTMTSDFGALGNKVSSVKVNENGINFVVSDENREKPQQTSECCKFFQSNILHLPLGLVNVRGSLMLLLAADTLSRSHRKLLPSAEAAGSLECRRLCCVALRSLPLALLQHCLT